MNDDVFRPGELCGTYRIVRLLGRGGFADVYQAIDVTTQQKVALKCLQLRHLTNARITQRMVAETELLAGLDHPNVVQVEDAGINGGVLWLAMEYLSGKTLRERLKAARGPLSPRLALYYARQIGEGVAAAHELNVVHRDLKPENIMITSKDQVKVLDLGAAKFFDSGLTLTGEGGVIGTPLYMSPEQVKAEAVDARADVYALGMILYEMLAGRHAFAQPSGELPPAFELGTLQLHAQPKPLPEVVRGVPTAVWELVEKAIAKDPAARFGTMAEFAWAIRVVWQSLSEKAEHLWEVVAADPGLEPGARGSQEEGSGAPSRGQPALRIVPAPKAKAAAEPEPRAEVAPDATVEVKPALVAAPVPVSAPVTAPVSVSAPDGAPAEPKAKPEPNAAPDPRELRRRTAGPIFSGAGAEEDEEEPRSGVRNIAASSPAAAAEPPKPAPPPPARVVRIGPGGRQGEILVQPEPAAAGAAESVEAPAVVAVASVEAPAVVAVASVEAPAVVAAESVQAPSVAAAASGQAPAAIAADAPLEVAQPASLVSTEIAPTAAAGTEEVLLPAINESLPAAAPDVPRAPIKLAEPAPPAAVVSLWTRLRAAARLRAGARAAALIAPMLVVLLALSLRPSELVLPAQSFLLDRVPDPALPSAPPPNAEATPAGENAAASPLAEADNDKSQASSDRRERAPEQTASAARPTTTTKTSARPSSDRTATAPGNITPAFAQESGVATSVKATQVSANARECEKMLFVPSDFRRRCSSAQAPSPTGQGRL